MNDECFDEATEQYVWVDSRTGLHRISQPMCEDCSQDAQPPETVAVFSVEGEGLPCYGEKRAEADGTMIDLGGGMVVPLSEVLEDD